MNSFFTLHSFLEVGKTQDLPSKFWQTLGDALMMDSSALSTPILNPNPFLKERDLLLFAPVVSLFGGSDHTGYSQQRFQSSEVPRFFSEVPTFKYSCYCSGSEGIYTPGPPTAILASPPNSNPL
jgi:hypothetical protein